MVNLQIENDVAEKYLSKMLEGYEGSLGQINPAIDQAETQMEGMKEQIENMKTQRDEMVSAAEEIRSFLGLPEEKEGVEEQGN